MFFVALRRNEPCLWVPMQLTRLAMLTLVATAAVFQARDALACGGCFHDPNENVSVVTDHRMIFSISKDQTTLYDEMRYSGDPASFAWVLPIRGKVSVGLSADVLFSALDSRTKTTVLAPQPPACAPLRCCRGDGTPFTSADSGASFDGGVYVIDQQVVGPYETVQLSSTDPSALETWLSSHGFVIPPDVSSIVAAYVAEKFDFLAMRLAPGQNVRAMRPVRITTPGATATLPLRMVSAGTGPNVGITLWVVGEGRWEPQNFPTFTIGNADLEWDFAAGRSNYAELRAAKTAASNGTAWELESSSPLDAVSLTSQVSAGVRSFDGGVLTGYLPTDGTDAKTAEQVRDEDLATLFHGLAPADLRVTLVRADLAHAALASDLALSASQDQSVLSPMRSPAKTKNVPVCPTTCGSGLYECDRDGGVVVHDDDGASTGGGGGCTVVAKDDGIDVPFAAGSVGALALGSIVRRIRRRRR
ncbi:hypothetical protein BH09MYX1_BH09MYX1_23800 [soil metagenome]